MREENHPLSGQNAPQRWQAIVTQFNVSFSIQQDRQRNFYEERFDSIRKEHQQESDSIFDMRAKLNEETCIIFDELDSLKDRHVQLSEEVESLTEEENHLKEELDKRRNFHENLTRREIELAKERDKREESVKTADLEKRDLIEQLKELRIFMQMKDKVRTQQISDSSPMIIVDQQSDQKNGRRKRKINKPGNF